MTVLGIYKAGFLSYFTKVIPDKSLVLSTLADLQMWLKAQRCGIAPTSAVAYE
ncbi:hypothetical protein NIES21_31700 [Anabaenopsis circularis NIES-21]|uniref:Uncharacterized protein n=1 Tax=Anabaenopsis circularis NIES-21 TaxID=1085406 RepID=A0A1Z4GII6_9CYAN|nr:hypothetical protein NIES21_31700 [Anabaenopsis circularis NIES-21]